METNNLDVLEAEWVDMFLRRFQGGVCQADVAYCSKCGFHMNVQITIWESHGLKYGKVDMPIYCPGCRRRIGFYNKK